MDNWIGKNIGRYHILEQIGSGGMAIVYKAYDTRLESEVALKVIRTDLFPPAALDRVLKRFEREAKSLARLNHPNIVKVIDYGEHDGSPYLVMSYLPGGTLKERTGQRMPWQDAISLLIPIARALAYAHTEGLLHRDVKPSNILITKSGEPVLTDFGIAKLLEPGGEHTLTGTGVGVGTPEYMAPEQGLGKDVDEHADVYALGVVLYELVTGRKPYTADTPIAVVVKQVNDPLPRPSQLAPGLPADIEKVLFKALAKKPEDRYASMADFAAALEKLARLDDHQPAHPAAAPAKPKPQPVPAAQPQPAAYPEDTYDGMPISPSPLKTTNNQGVPVWAWGLGGLLLLSLGGFLLLSIAGLGLKSLAAVKPDPTATRQPTGTEIPSPTQTKPPLPTLTFTPALTLTPTLVGSSMTWEKDGMEMMFVPAGEFEMGSNNGDDDEKPVHTVYLDAYWMDKYEVTNAQYEQCVAESACKESTFKFDSEFNGSNQPVVGVDWHNAKAYCEWAGRRLPTEAEWEKAARGTDGRIYPWGNIFDCSKGNFDDETKRNTYIVPGGAGCDGYNTTAPVGSFTSGASPYGVMDMAGNVWEWTADCYGKYKGGKQENPAGASCSNTRVVRGGSWVSDVSGVRSADRGRDFPVGRSSFFGFRCAAAETGVLAVITENANPENVCDKWEHASIYNLYATKYSPDFLGSQTLGGFTVVINSSTSLLEGEWEMEFLGNINNWASGKNRVICTLISNNLHCGGLDIFDGGGAKIIIRPVGNSCIVFSSEIDNQRLSELFKYHYELNK